MWHHNTEPTAEDASNNRFCCCFDQFFRSCSDAHPLGKHGAEDSQAAWGSQEGEGQEPHGTGVDGWLQVQDRRMHMRWHHVNFHIPLLPLQIASGRVLPGSREITQRLLLQFTWAAFIRIAGKLSSCWEGWVKGGPGDGDSAVAQGWPLVSHRESCWVTSDKEWVQNTNREASLSFLCCLEAVL